MSFTLQRYTNLCQTMMMLLSSQLFFAISVLSLFSYLASALVVFKDVTSATPLSQRRRLILSLLSFGLLSQALLNVHSMSIGNAVPSDFFSMLSLVFTVIVFLFLIETIKTQVETLVIIVAPLAAISVLLNSQNATPATSETIMPLALQGHIVLSILAYSILSVAAFQAILLSIQEKQLHERQPSRFIAQLPALQLMENLLFQALILGVITLTLALGSGFVFLDDIFAQQLSHKTFFSIIAWLVFAMLLLGRSFFGWRGQKVVKLTIWGYFALVLAYFGSKFVLQLILN